MAVMLGYLFDALRAGGAPHDLALEAAEEVAEHLSLRRRLSKGRDRSHFPKLYDALRSVAPEKLARAAADEASRWLAGKATQRRTQ